MTRRSLIYLALLAVISSACLGNDAAANRIPPRPRPPTPSFVSPATNPPAPPPTPTVATVPPTTISAFARPDWLGTRLLPLRDDEFGEVQPTPPEMIDRRFETIDALPPPSDDGFAWAVGSVPPDVLARSSWTEDCPVAANELVYLTVSHWGFDERAHTGEMLVNAAWGQEIVDVFRRLYDMRFPIEQMRVIAAEEIDAHPTGDWNDTTSFVCRPAVGSGNWSRHAYGLAIDVNPFHNPYLKGDLVIPELASAYLDRAFDRPGMILGGDEVVQAFAEIGWPWGGDWNSLKDWMHFSDNGR